MNIIKIIEKNNLSIRRLPDEIISLYDIRHKKDGDIIITQNNRQFVKRVKIPEHAGWYTVKQVNNTDSMVQWNLKTCFLAKTLKESINLFLLSKN